LNVIIWQHNDGNLSLIHVIPSVWNTLVDF